MRPASPDGFATMQRLLAESLEAGAFGLSTGLIYVPSYADIDELVTLSRVVRRYGGIYASHPQRSGGLLAAVHEAIEIGRQAGLRCRSRTTRPPGAPTGARYRRAWP